MSLGTTIPLWLDFDLSGILQPLYTLTLFGILLFAGIMAFKYVPKGLNIIIAFALIGLGFAILLGYVVITW